MDLSAAIVYNGLTALPPSASPSAPKSGVEFESVDISDITTDAYMDRRALQDGADVSDVYLGMRSVRIQGAAFGTSKGHAFDQLQAVLHAFSPTIAYNADTANRGFLAFQFQQTTISTSVWTAGYVPMQFYLRPLSPPRYTINRAATADTRGRGFSVPFTAQLVARDPRKYAQTAQSVSISTATSPNVPHRGDYPTLPIITMTITSAGSSAFTVFVDGTSVNVNLSTVTSGVLSLDYSTRMLTDANGVSYQSLVAGNFTPVRAGGVQIYVTTMTGLSSVTADYREAWS